MTIYTLLRQPEAELFRTDTAADAFVNFGELNIRRPFAPIVPTWPLDWTMDPYVDRTWQLYFHSLYWAQTIDYAIDLNPDQADQLVDRLKEIVMSYVMFTESEAANGMQAVWDDHAVAYRLSHISYFYARRLRHVLSPSEDLILRKFAKKHINLLQDFLRSDHWTLSNHTLFQIEGALDGAFIFLEGKAQADTFDFALLEFNQWVSRVVNIQDGSAAEHAAFYHAFLMKRLNTFAQYAAPIVGAHKIAGAQDMVLKMAPFLWDMSVEARHPAAFGDTKYNMKLDQKFVDDFLAPPFRTDMVDHLITPETFGAPPCGITAYKKNGYYFVRTGQVDGEAFLSMMDKPFVGPHGHMDGLSFELYLRRKPLLIDSGGPYKYGHQLRFQYFRKAIGHNVVVVGDGQQDYTSRISRSEFTNGIAVIKGNADIVPGVIWRRAVVMLGNDYALVCDILDGDLQNQSAYARFQLPPETDLTHESNGRYTIKREGVSTGALLLHGASLGHTLDPTPQEPNAFVPDKTQCAQSLHDIALITHEDNNFLTAPVIRGNMTVAAPHVAIFGLKRAYPMVNIDIKPGRGGRILRLPSSMHGEYCVTITDLAGDDAQLSDFQISAIHNTK